MTDRFKNFLRPARSFAMTFWAHGPAKILRYGGVLGLESLTRGFGILMLVPILAAAGIGGGEEAGTGPLRVVAHFLFTVLGIPRELFWVLAVFLGLMIFREFLSRTQKIMAQELELEFVRGLRERLYAALVHAEWLFLARRRGSDFMQVLTTDLERAGEAAFHGIRIVSSGVMGFVYLGLALWVSPWLTGATALAAGLLFLIFRRSMTKAHEHGQALTLHQNQMFGAVTDELGAMKMSKSYGAEGRSLRRYAKEAREIDEASMLYLRHHTRTVFWYHTHPLNPAVTEKPSFTSLFRHLKIRCMPKPRLIIPHSSDGTLPDLAIYHTTSRVVHRQFLFQAEEKEQFRILMRMYERFSGCRVLSFCVMTNHFHLLLEVPPPPTDGDFGISEEELIHRLGGLYSGAYVAGVKAEILEARTIAEGKREHFSRLSKADQKKEKAYGRALLAAIFERYTKRMNNLSEFMRGLLQRYTRWFNKRHGMRGTLWEDRFHSVIVQSGLASRTMAAYIDLNPVRAGICKDPADYRWSSYGEAVGGGRGATKAQSGLVRALRGHEGHAGTSRAWAQGGISKDYRKLLLTNGSEQTEDCSDGRKRTHRKGVDRKVAEKEKARLESEEARDLKIAKAVQCKVRYFRDGAVLGSKKFVNDFFENQRDRFGPKRKDGARKARGSLKELAGEIWSLRDLKDG